MAATLLTRSHEPTPSPDTIAGPHWMTLLDGIATDITDRQLHRNLASSLALNTFTGRVLSPTLGDVSDLPTLDTAGNALRDHVLRHSVRRGQFTLKSGATSTWFLDTKQTACRPDGIIAVADALLAIIPDDATAIGGLTMGADPVAFGVAAVAATRGRDLRSFSVRKDAKDHGVTGRLAGALEPNTTTGW
ncbi:MAG: hypothetical protein EBS20_11415 [Actinobacteria bacterium]|nr:hypothetical protein [Actinomycetota bacterium]